MEDRNHKNDNNNDSLSVATAAVVLYPNMSLTTAKIPCCLCGVMIAPNAANQCGICLAQEVDLAQKLQQGPGGSDYTTIYQCRQCRRYQQTEKHYIACEWESPELLALCLKKIPALQSTATPRLHLVDAQFVWTEPHSMRCRIHTTVRTELHGVQVQQRTMVECHIKWQMCVECNREYTNRTWHALIQLRQKRGNDPNAPKKGLVALEMALAKNANIRKHVLKIDNCRHGYDFYFLHLNQAQAFASFLQRVAPMRTKTSSKMVSQDFKNNTCNMKYTIACDMVPLCRDDLVLIHKSCPKSKLSGRIVLVTRIASTIHFVDASPPTASSSNNTAAVADIQMELSPDTYYKQEKYYKVLTSSHRLQRFVVLDVELIQTSSNTTSSIKKGGQQGEGEQQQHESEIDEDNNSTTLYRGPASGIEKYALADVEVAREADFGVNDDTYRCMTHLGHLISAGDTVLGYDVTSELAAGSNTADHEIENSIRASYTLPDVVLVKKISGNKDKGNKNADRFNVDDDGAVASTATESNNDTGKVSEEDDDADEEGDGTISKQEEPDGKPKLSKKKQRRIKRQEGKRRKHLEESAVRMGFISDMPPEEEEGFEDDDDEYYGDFDPDLKAEVEALDREFSALDCGDKK